MCHVGGTSVTLPCMVATAYLHGENEIRVQKLTKLLGRKKTSDEYNGSSDHMMRVKMKLKKAIYQSSICKTP